MRYKIIEKLLTPNKYSRPQDKLKGVKGIVVHWVANPQASAEANRNFFENRKYGKTGYGSAHYIIDLNGDVIRCIPENEVAYHVGSKTYTKEALSKLSTYPNNCTIGIECCHVDWNGKMTDATYNTLVELATDLLKKYKLTTNDLWLHKEVVGWKDCHKWFVDHPDEWVKFKKLVADRLNLKPIQKTNEKQSVQKLTPQPKQEKVATPTVQSQQNKQSLQEVMIMKMSDFVNNYNMKQLEEIYKKAHEEGLLNDNTWAEKAANKTITVGEVAFLATILDQRRFEKYCKK